MELEVEKAKLRRILAAALSEENEAAKLGAEAEEAIHRAVREPARQRQALFAGWSRIITATVAGIAALSMSIIGVLVDPLGFPLAVIASLVLYPLKPWQFPLRAVGTNEAGTP